VSVRYRLMYRLGLTPWDDGHVARELVALAEGSGALPPGRALDLGCGTGTHAVYLAQRGWRVVAIDSAPRALETACQRAGSAGVSPRLLKADVADLPALGLEPGFTLIHDRGCFHDLDDGTRDAYARGVTALSERGATLLMMAFLPRRGVGPRGVSQHEIRARFGDWTLRGSWRDSGPPPPGPMRNVPRVWYRLERR